MPLIELIGWAGTACQMLGLIFNAHKSMWCWPIWLGSNVFLVTYSIVLTLWPILILNGFLYVLTYTDGGNGKRQNHNEAGQEAIG